MELQSSATNITSKCSFKRKLYLAPFQYTICKVIFVSTLKQGSPAHLELIQFGCGAHLSPNVESCGKTQPVNHGAGLLTCEKVSLRRSHYSFVSTTRKIFWWGRVHCINIELQYQPTHPEYHSQNQLRKTASQSSKKKFKETIKSNRLK